MIRLNSGEVQNFHFKPKLSFLRENHKTDNYGNIKLWQIRKNPEIQSSYPKNVNFGLKMKFLKFVGI